MYYLDILGGNHKDKKNHDFVIDLSQNNNASINNRKISWDIASISEKYFHLIINHHSFRCEVMEFDAKSKSFVFKINGETVAINLRDEKDMMLKKLGIAVNNELQVNEISAPMPGLILNIKVAVGQFVKKDEQLLVLNAMKMENIIKSPLEGTVKKVLVKAGQNVEKNQLLIQF